MYIAGLFIIVILTEVRGNLQKDILIELSKNNSAILNRQRRYLVFPEGSSFQVVFDLTIPSVAIQGNVFLFGHTAAMAWELPSTPIFLDNKIMEKNVKDEPIMTTPEAEYGWGNTWEWYQFNYAHNHEKSIPYTWNVPMSKPELTLAHHIQRRSRRALYGKIEKLLSALNKDGKSCVLKIICQVKKLRSGTGTMWEEIIKAIFKAKHDHHPNEDHYDQAADERHDCDAMYPNCHGHVLSDLFGNRLNSD